MQANPRLAGLDAAPLALQSIAETLREISSLIVDIDARAFVETGGGRSSKQGRF